jgi:Telomerase ribonucleoprotein complex - RNA binding domain
MDVLRRVGDAVVPLGPLLRFILATAQDLAEREEEQQEQREEKGGGSGGEKDEAEERTPPSSIPAGRRRVRPWSEPLKRAAAQSTELNHLLEHTMVVLRAEDFGVALLGPDLWPPTPASGAPSLSGDTATASSSLPSSSSYSSSISYSTHSSGSFAAVDRDAGFPFTQPSSLMVVNEGTWGDVPPAFGAGGRKKASSSSGKKAASEAARRRRGKRRRQRRRHVGDALKRQKAAQRVRERAMVRGIVTRICASLRLHKAALVRRETQRVVVDHVLWLLLSRGSDSTARNAQHTLTLGFQKDTQQYGSSAATTGRDARLVQTYPNAMVSLVRHSVCFRDLHESIGDELFSFILTRLSLFVCVCDRVPAGWQPPDDVFVQLSGIQVTGLARIRRRVPRFFARTGAGASVVGKKRGAADVVPCRKEKRRRLGGADASVNDVVRQVRHTRRGRRGGRRRTPPDQTDAGREKSAPQGKKRSRRRTRRNKSRPAELAVKKRHIDREGSPSFGLAMSVRATDLNRSAVLYRFAHKNTPRTDFVYALCESYTTQSRLLEAEADSQLKRDKQARNTQRHCDALIRKMLCRPKTVEAGQDIHTMSFRSDSVLAWVSKSLTNVPKSLRRYRLTASRMLLRCSKQFGLLSERQLDPSLFLLNLRCPLHFDDDASQATQSTQLDAPSGGRRNFRAKISTLTDTELHQRICLHRQVSLFVWNFLERVCPPTFGLKAKLARGIVAKNARCLRTNVFTFVCLKKFERVSIPQLLLGLKSTHTFLSDGSKCRSLTRSIALVERISRMMLFLFSDMIIPLMKRHFYATELGDQRFCNPLEVIGTRADTFFS